MKSHYFSLTILLLLISSTFQQGVTYEGGGATGYSSSSSNDQSNSDPSNNMENQETFPAEPGETAIISSESGETAVIITESGEDFAQQESGEASTQQESGETSTQQQESGETAAAVGENGEAAQGEAQTTTPHTVFPPSTLNTWVVDIHYLSGRGLNTSHPSFHYCYELSPGFIQCDLYNGTANNSRLLGVELVVTGDILQTFDVEERKLWYPHSYEVLNGFLVIPDLSPDAELEVMKVLVNTYAKTTAFYPQDPNFPIGAPQVAYGWVTDDQVNATLATEIDQLLNLTTTFEQRKAARQGLEVDPLVDGVNSWTNDGESPQYQVFSISVDTDNNEPL